MVGTETTCGAECTVRTLGLAKSVVKKSSHSSSRSLIKARCPCMRCTWCFLHGPARNGLPSTPWVGTLTSTRIAQPLFVVRLDGEHLSDARVGIGVGLPEQIFHTGLHEAQHPHSKQVVNAGVRRPTRWLVPLVRCGPCRGNRARPDHDLFTTGLTSTPDPQGGFKPT